MAHSKIALLWAQKIEIGEKTIDEVPAKLKEEVLEILVEDGFVE